MTPTIVTDETVTKVHVDNVIEVDLAEGEKVVSISDTAINLNGFVWGDCTVPDGDWWNAYPDSKLIVVKDGVRYVHPITFKGE